MKYKVLLSHPFLLLQQEGTLVRLDKSQKEAKADYDEGEPLVWS